MKNVLITGMSGLIGGILRRHLEEKGDYKLRALNRSVVEGVDSFQGDISDLDAIRSAFEGQDVVVHLAAYLGGKDWEGQLNGNIIGTYNVFEAARLAGVARVVYASSGNTIRGFEDVAPYDAIAAGRFESVPDDFAKITHEQVRPADIYGAAKVFGEALARHFSDEYGMSMIGVRIGGVRPGNRPTVIRERSIYLSHDDVASVLTSCVDAADDLKCDVFLATSNNKWSYRDLTHPKDVLGWSPKDSSDDFYDD